VTKTKETETEKEQEILKETCTNTRRLEIPTCPREEQIFDLKGPLRLLPVTTFQLESYLILPIKPKICNTEFTTY